MNKVLILYPKVFNCYTKFERKLSRVLSNMKKYKPIDSQKIIEAVYNDVGLPKNFSECYQKLITSQTAQTGKEPTVDELRNLQAAVYSLFS